MKRVFFAVLIAVFAVGLCSCGKSLEEISVLKFEISDDYTNELNIRSLELFADYEKRVLTFVFDTDVNEEGIEFDAGGEVGESYFDEFEKISSVLREFSSEVSEGSMRIFVFENDELVNDFYLSLSDSDENGALILNFYGNFLQLLLENVE